MSPAWVGFLVGFVAPIMIGSLLGWAASKIWPWPGSGDDT